MWARVENGEVVETSPSRPATALTRVPMPEAVVDAEGAPVYEPDELDDAGEVVRAGELVTRDVMTDAVVSFAEDTDDDELAAYGWVPVDDEDPPELDDEAERVDPDNPRQVVMRAGRPVVRWNVVPTRDEDRKAARRRAVEVELAGTDAELLAALESVLADQLPAELVARRAELRAELDGVDVKAPKAAKATNAAKAAR